MTCNSNKEQQLPKLYFMYRSPLSCSSINSWLHTNLDTVALLKKKATSQRHLTPWYNPQIWAFKYRTHKLERKWHLANLEDLHLAWINNCSIRKKRVFVKLGHLTICKKEENGNLPGCQPCTQADREFELCWAIALALTSDDFTHFFKSRLPTDVPVVVADVC